MDFPDKLYYRIGEVSKIAGVPAYVLRFWESEFSAIRPGRTPSGQRLYRKKDVELILTVKQLLYDKKFTIEGARNQLAITPNIVSSSDDEMSIKHTTVVQSNKEASVLLEVRDQLKSILDIINS